MLTDNAGPVIVEVPRDRNGTFEPVIVPKRTRRLGDVDAIVLSLFAKGLTTGEISAHFAEICVRRCRRRRSRGSLPGSSTSSRGGGPGRPRSRRRRLVADLWAGNNGGVESAKYWLAVLTELKTAA